MNDKFVIKLLYQGISDLCSPQEGLIRYLPRLTAWEISQEPFLRAAQITYPHHSGVITYVFGMKKYFIL